MDVLLLACREQQEPRQQLLPQTQQHLRQVVLDVTKQLLRSPDVDALKSGIHCATLFLREECQPQEVTASLQRELLQLGYWCTVQVGGESLGYLSRRNSCHPVEAQTYPVAVHVVECLLLEVVHAVELVLEQQTKREARQPCLICWMPLLGQVLPLVHLDETGGRHLEWTSIVKIFRYVWHRQILSPASQRSEERR